MEALTLLVLAAVAIAVLLLPIPKKIQNRQKQRRARKYHTSGAFLGAVTEIFQPSAANASVIVEEQKVARKATPAPEDKLNRS
jgi:hypothetical protein